MGDLVKNLYNKENLNKLALDIKYVYNSFQVNDFLNAVIDNTWSDLEYKQRMRHITINLRKFLPNDYCDAIDIINDVVIIYGKYGSWVENDCLFFPYFVELYGKNEKNWDISMEAIARYTPYATAEFAVRAFIISYEKRMMAQMFEWTKHENEHIRRLASEGCRPALPWGQALTKYKEDPTPVLLILEKLKVDPSPYVRKSVANNLNDISKNHPDLVVKLAKEWYGKNEYTNWIVKHGCRTLLKNGNRDALAIFGYNGIDSIEVKKYALDTTSTTIGGDIKFSFEVHAREATKIRLEYGIDYVKANHKRSRKVFKISETRMAVDQKKLYTRKHVFKDLSTRKHYPGSHSITLIVNGVEQGTLDFEVKL